MGSTWKFSVEELVQKSHFYLGITNTLSKGEKMNSFYCVFNSRFTVMN